MIGSHKQCNKYCMENTEKSFQQHARGANHVIENKNDYIRKVQDHIQENSRKLYRQKVNFVKNYFSEVHNQVNIVKGHIFKDLEKGIVPAVLSINTHQRVIKNVEEIDNGSTGTLSCSDISEINESLDRTDYVNNTIYKTTLLQMFHQVMEATKKVQYSFSKNNQMRDDPIKIVRKQRFDQPHSILMKTEKKQAITLIKDIPQRNGEGNYTIKVMIQKFRATVQTRKGTMLRFKVSDESGVNQFSCFKHQLMEQGNELMISNCYTRVNKGHFQITVRENFEITLLQSKKGFKKEGPSGRNDTMRQGRRGPRRGGNNRNKRQQQPRRGGGGQKRYEDSQNSQSITNYRYERDQITSQKSQKIQSRRPRRDRDIRNNNQTTSYQRQERENDRKIIRRKETRTQDQTFKTQRRPRPERRNVRDTEDKMNKFQIPNDITKIKDIGPGDEGLKIFARVCQTICQKGLNLEFLIGDQTGTVRALIPERFEFIKENQSIYLENIEASVVKEQIVLTYLQGQEKIAKKVGKNIPKIDFTNNISLTKWVADQEYQ